MISINIGVVVILIIIHEVVNSGHEASIDDYEEHNQVYFMTYCNRSDTVESEVLEILTDVFELGIFVMCLYYLYRIKDVPASVNEASSVFVLMLPSMGIIIAGPILISMFDIYTGRLIEGLCYALVILLVFCALFVPKFVKLYEELKISALIRNGSSSLAYKKKSNDVDDNSDYIDTMERLKHLKSIEERCRLCHQMQDIWTLALLRILDEENESSHSSSKTLSVIEGGGHSSSKTVSVIEGGASKVVPES